MSIKLMYVKNIEFGCMDDSDIKALFCNESVEALADLDCFVSGFLMADKEGFFKEKHLEVLLNVKKLISEIQLYSHNKNKVKE